MALLYVHTATRKPVSTISALFRFSRNFSHFVTNFTIFPRERGKFSSCQDLRNNIWKLPALYSGCTVRWVFLQRLPYVYKRVTQDISGCEYSTHVYLVLNVIRRVPRRSRLKQKKTKRDGWCKIQKLCYFFNLNCLTFDKKMIPCILVDIYSSEHIFEVTIEVSICWILQRAASDGGNGSYLLGQWWGCLLIT
jgi:hypothetical protein